MSTEDEVLEGDVVALARPSRRPWLLLAAIVAAVLAIAGGFAAGYYLGGATDDIVGGLPSSPGVTLLEDAATSETAADAAAGAASGPVVEANLLASGVALADLGTGKVLQNGANQGQALPGPAMPPAAYVAHLPVSYTLPIRYGLLGPQLVGAGVIDLPAFVGLYDASATPLTDAQLAILRDGSQALVTIDAENAHFLLNFFWAVGLANRNAILLEGAMQQYGPEGVVQFASTGGWTLAASPVADLYASLPLIELSESQQARLQAVAENVYRPCCGNSTAFPDCNHGMAMLGILELMAAGDATEEQMYEAAKYISAFWFPREVTEAAAYFKLAQDLDFAAIDPRRLVSRDILSSSGAQSIKQWLANAGRLGEPNQNGASCGA